MYGKHLTWLETYFEHLAVCRSLNSAPPCKPFHVSDERPFWEQQWLPLWPLASDNLRDGIYRMSRESALGLRYIEANPRAVSNLLVVDIDHEDSALRAMWNRHQWLPNAIVENPKNGHAHAVWALREAITRTEYARRKPLAFAAAVTEGLRRSVEGDQAYSGLITKNPTHEAWDTFWLTDHLYSLGELREHLDEAGFMPAPGWARTRRRNPVGLGRNCDIFESARTWAYRVARQIRLRHEYATMQDESELHEAITNEVHALNSEYSDPLRHSEAKAIAESIYRWITTHSDLWNDASSVSQASFTLIQSARAQKLAEQRRADRLDLFASIAEEATR